MAKWTVTKSRKVASKGVAKPPSEETTVALWRPVPGTAVKKEPPPNEKEAKLLADLVEHAKSFLLPEDDSYFEREKRWALKDDAVCLLRFLRASKGNVQVAKARYEETCNWRREFKPDLISPKDIWDEAETGKVILTGFDQDGRPIMYLRPAREQSKNSETKIKHLVFQLERCIDLMDVDGVSKMALVVDYAGAGAKSNPGMSETKQVLDIFQKHYCERLGRAIIVNLPWYLSGFFKAISPLLDPVSREKMKFNANMTDLIPSSQLDVEFGGEYNFKYDRDVYLPALCTFCGVNNDGSRVPDADTPLRKPVEVEEKLEAVVVAEAIDKEEAGASAPSGEGESTKEKVKKGPRAVAGRMARRASAFRTDSSFSRSSSSSQPSNREEGRGPINKVMSSLRTKSEDRSKEANEMLAPQTAGDDADPSPAKRRDTTTIAEEDGAPSSSPKPPRTRQRARAQTHSDIRRRMTTKDGWRRMLGLKSQRGRRPRSQSSPGAIVTGDLPASKTEVAQSPDVAPVKLDAEVEEAAKATAQENEALEEDVHVGSPGTKVVPVASDERRLSEGAAPVAANDQREHIAALPSRPGQIGPGLNLVRVSSPEAIPGTQHADDDEKDKDRTGGDKMAIVASGSNIFDDLAKVMTHAAAAMSSKKSGKSARSVKGETSESEGEEKIDSDQVHSVATEVPRATVDPAQVIVARDSLNRQVTDLSMMTTNSEDLDFGVTMNAADYRQLAGGAARPAAVSA